MLRLVRAKPPTSRPYRPENDPKAIHMASSFSRRAAPTGHLAATGPSRPDPHATTQSRTQRLEPRSEPPVPIRMRGVPRSLPVVSNHLSTLASRRLTARRPSSDEQLAPTGCLHHATHEWATIWRQVRPESQNRSGVARSTPHPRQSQPVLPPAAAARYAVERGWSAPPRLETIAKTETRGSQAVATSLETMASVRRTVLRIVPATKAP